MTIPKGGHDNPPIAAYTAFDAIPRLVADARKTFNTGVTKSLDWRKRQLRALYDMTVKEEEAIAAALYRDHKKVYEDSLIFELVGVRNEIAEILENLDDWMTPEPVSGGSIAFAAHKFQIRHDPLGVVLIINTWNYPVNVSLIPLASALGGGNAAILKFTEVAPHTSTLLMSLIPKYLDADAVKCVFGAVPETTILLEQKTDLIIYTGNSAVGRIIMAAASKHLTPVLLELGGKSPVIIDKDVDVMIAARRIAWAKIANAGQVYLCRPDYVYVHKDIAEAFYAAIPLAVAQVHGDPTTSSIYSRIINRHHFDRLKGVLDAQLKVPGTELVFGGQTNASDLFIAPTFVRGVTADSKTHPLMRSEIFGPILPILEYTDLNAVIADINGKGEAPLALYPFSRSSAFVERVIAAIPSGGVMANDLLFSLGITGLPFGGVGTSGMGAYHGKHGFDACTHKRAVSLVAPGLESANDMRYPNKVFDMKGSAWKTIKFLMFRDLSNVTGVRGLLFSTIRAWQKRVAAVGGNPLLFALAIVAAYRLGKLRG
ncbi:Aldehyde/histidinol dehydrogenase [Entophlyctis helioformis]|nr:Aldehyde/histidinol dehydrogenase [Entophlyctis helioformis]